MFDWSKAGLNCVATTGSGDVVTIQGFNCVFKIVLNLVVQFAGIAVFILLLVGGFKYLTSGGEPEKKKSASNTITYAILGLALLLGSWLILLLIQEITGVPVTQFVIPGP